MLARLRRNRLLLKYVMLTAVLLSVIAGLEQLQVFSGLGSSVSDFFNRIAEYGLIGMFFIGLVSNTVLVVQIPYNLPMFTLVIYAHSALDVMAVGAATGFGGGIGEVISYAVAHSIVARVEAIENSSLFRWTKKTIERHPIVIPFFVAFVSGVPIPDVMIILPLAMIHYPWQKMVIPMVAGKIFQNVVVALIFRYAADSASDLLANDINFGLTAGLLILFIMIIAYQIETARSNLGNNHKPAAVEEASAAE